MLKFWKFVLVLMIVLSCVVTQKTALAFSGCVKPLTIQDYSGTTADFNRGFTTLYCDRYTSTASNYYEGIGSHPGVDIARLSNGSSSNGASVHAMYDGVVARVLSGYGGGWGNCLVIRHVNMPDVGTIYSIYGHMNRFEGSYSVGTPISKGQVIGYVGSTGNSTGAHLHFQIDRDYSDTVHPYFPSGTDPVNQPDSSNKVRNHTISPLAYVQNHLNGDGGTYQPDWDGYLDVPANSATVRYVQEVSGWGRDKSGRFPVTAVVIYINGEEIGHASHNLPRADLPGNFAYTYSWDTSRWSGQNVTVRARVFSGDKFFDREKTVYVGFKVGQDAVHWEPFAQAFDRNGKEANMGWPYEKVHWNGNVQVQGFDGGAYGSCAIIHDVNATDPGGNAAAWVVRGAIGYKYTIVGENYTAAPRSDERDADPSPYGTTGRVQNFRQGVICSSPAGLSLVINDIFNKYLSVGASGGVLGFPGSDHYRIVEGHDWFRQNFEGGNIYQSELGVFVMVDKVRAYGVAEDIRQRFHGNGAEQGPFGLVASDEYEITSSSGKKGREQNFVGGNIFSSEYGVAMLLNGSIRDRYYAMQAQEGPLGLLKSDQSGGTGSFGTHADWQIFEGGAIQKTDRGTFSIYGDINQKYATLGGGGGPLGYAVSDKGDGIGSFGTHADWQIFEGGSIIVTNAGVFAVFGEIDDKYAAQGGGGGPLGFPISDAYPYLGGTRQDFEGGFLTTGVSFELSLNPTSVSGGTSVVGKVTLPGVAPDGGVTIALSSDNSSVGVPATIIVPAGETSQTFVVTTVPVTEAKNGVITASFADETKTATLALTAVTYDLQAATELKATVQGANVVLTWKDNSTGETGYKVERKIGSDGRWVQLLRGEVPDQNSFTDGDVAPNVSYYYRVYAHKNRVGNGPLGEVVQIQIEGVNLVAATNLTAAVGADGASIVLNWRDASSAETGYKVERRVGSGSWSQIYRGTTPNQTRFTDGDVAPGVRYSYRVRAHKDRVGNGPYSNVAEAIIEIVDLKAPSNLTATVRSDGSAVELAWRDNASGETGFKISRRIGNGSWVEIARGTTPDQNRYTDGDVAPGTTYFYRVRAYRVRVGDSSYSNTASATVEVLALRAPTNLTATLDADGTSAILNWTDNATGVTGYKVYRRAGNGSWVEIARGDAPHQTSFADSDLETGVRYTYRVRAYKTRVGDSSYSNEATVTTPLSNDAPGASGGGS